MFERFLVLDTDDFDEHRSRRMALHPETRAIEKPRSDPFRGRLSAAPLGDDAEGSVIEHIYSSSSLAFNYDDTDLVRVLIGSTAALRGDCAGEQRELRQGSSAAFMPATRMKGAAQPGYTLLYRARASRVRTVMEELECAADIKASLDRLFFQPHVGMLKEVAAHARQLAVALDREPDKIISLRSFRECANQIMLIRLAWTIASAQKAVQARSADRRRRIIGRAVDYIHEKSATGIDLFALAKYSGSSYRTLARAFRDEYDCTIHEFIMRHRLAEARRALEKPDSPKTVREIAEAIGFNHMGEFAKAYRHRYGELPFDTLSRARGP